LADYRGLYFADPLRHAKHPAKDQSKSQQVFLTVPFVAPSETLP
jgi:hypothetical protein